MKASVKQNRLSGRRPVASLSEESDMQKLKEYRMSKGDILVEKWSRTRPGVKLDKLFTESSNKARLVAHALEMQNRHIKSLKESGTLIKSAFQTTPENLLRMVRIGTANSNRSEIFDEWSLETPDDAFFFVDTIFGTTARGATAGELVYEKTYPNYATEFNTATLGTGNGVILTFGPVSFSPVPIIPNTVRVFVDNKPVGNDDGVSSFTGATISTAGSSINYTTGAITVVFTAGNAPANGASITVEAQWDSENSSNYDEWAQIELKLRKDRFNARMHPVTYQYSQLLELTLGSEGVGNIDEMLVKRVGDAHAKSKDEKAFQIAMRLARKNTIETFDADFNAAGADNPYNWNQTLLRTISKISGKIYNEAQRGAITRIVAGSSAISELEMVKTWETDTTQPRGSGSYLAGRLGAIPVYSTPANSQTINSDEALCVYKNEQEDGDVAIAFGVMTEMAATLDYPELYRKGTIARVEDWKEINSKFLRILKFTGV